MASPAEHQACSQDFAVLADACRGEQISGKARGASWEIVLLFYSALHLIEGYLRAKGEEWASTDHGTRKSRIKGATELRQGNASACFFDLQDMSVDVRYSPDFQPDAEDFRNAREWAKKITDVVAPKLKTKLEDAK